jgi:hypothetical protein
MFSVVAPISLDKHSKIVVSVGEETLTDHRPAKSKANHSFNIWYDTSMGKATHDPD